jgi:hypothetical protein
MRSGAYPVANSASKCDCSSAALRRINRLENLMSNESQSGNAKTGQQSQSTAPQTGKDAPQQGGSDQKSGQQSQGESQKGGDGMKQAGSANIANDPKKATESGQQSGSSK